MTAQNLAAMFFERAEGRSNHPRYRVKRGDAWKEVTWSSMATLVRETASGLLELGIAPGQKVAILAATRPEWVEVDLAIYSCGGVSVPIYQSNLPHECGYILSNSESRICFVEDSRQLEKIRIAQREGFELDGQRFPVEVSRIVVMDGESDGADALTLSDLRASGRSALERNQETTKERIAALGRDDLATIVYTSGTTGPPKGVMQTHGNHLAALEAVDGVGLAREGDVHLFFLPLAHSFARMLEYFDLWVGTVTAFATSIDALAQEIVEARPDVVVAVPRVYEKIYGRIMSTRAGGSAIKRWLFDWALEAGRARSRCQQQRQPVPPLVAVRAAVADLLVLSRVREVLGGRLRVMVSGGAPLAREIMEFFHAAGLLILEGYGLTETAPVLTVNRPDNYKFGSVGQAIDGVTLDIAADGEILGKGPNVARGYYKRPDATAEAWDSDGWFHTGDVGEIDADGFLRITDRKKDLIKTSGGKYVAPQNIENLLKTQPHISQAVVIGDNRKYCVALLTLDFDEIERFAKEQQIAYRDRSELCRHPRVLELIDADVRAVNEHLASYESIKYFRILDRDFSQDTGELTPSLKVKRKVVTKRFRELIDEMYT